MPNQLDTPTTISIPAAVLLGVAVTAAATLTVIVAIQSVVSLHVYEGATSLLAALVALTGTGVIICTVADRVMRRLDELERRLMPQTAGRPHLSLVEETSVGIDPEAIESARKIARDLMAR